VLTLNNEGSGYLILFILIIAAGALIYLHFSGYLVTGSALVNSGQSSNCPINSNVSNLCYAPTGLQGGAVTSVSQASFVSQTKGIFSGPAYLVDFVVTGGGEQLAGTTQGTLASNLNSSYKSSNPNAQVSVNFGLVNAYYSIPFESFGHSIKQVSYTTTPIVWSTQSYSGGDFFHPNCYDSLQSNNTYYLGCNGGGVSSTGIQTAFYYNITQAAYACVRTGQNNVLGISAGYSGSSTTGILQLSSTLPNATFQCLVPQYTNITSGIYDQQGTFRYYSNVSIAYSNGTSQGTAYVNSYSAPSAYFLNGNGYAAITGYQPSGFGLNGQVPYVVRYTSSPSLGAVGGTIQLVSGPDIADALSVLPNQGSGAPSFTTGILGGQAAVQGIAINDGIVPYAYLTPNINAGVGYANRQILSYLVNTQPSNFYSSKVYYSSFNNTESMIVPVYNQTLFGSAGINPNIGSIPYQPNLQLVLKLNTLSVYVPSTPVGSVKILSIVPNPVTIRSGSSVPITVNIQNTANVSASFYVNGQCGTIQFGSATTALSIAAGATANPQYVLNAPYVANGTSSQVAQCIVQAVSVSNPAVTSSATFSETVTPQCSSAGGIVNNSNCQAEPTIPTTSVPVPPPPPPPPLNIWPFVAFGVVVLIVLVLLAANKFKKYTPQGAALGLAHKALRQGARYAVGRPRQARLRAPKHR
jgi:hypothetical protein